MNLEQHNTRDDMKVWLSLNEVNEFVETAPTMEQRIAFELGAYCGLRSHEILCVEPADVVSTDAGWFVRVWEGKGDKYRETPCPSDLAMRIQTVEELRSEGGPILSVTSTRSLRRWVSKTADALATATGDEGWSFLSTHDLRRTWAGQLRHADVDALVVLSWGGWNDLETFLEHYKGKDTPETQRRERGKVDFL